MNTHQIGTTLGAGLLLAVLAAAPALAADCGDTAGPDGERVACECGDTVVASTKLKGKDPVAKDVCAGTALRIGADDIDLMCKGRWLTGSGDGAGIDVQTRSNVALVGCKIQGFAVGIRMGQWGSGVEIHKAVLKENGNGIYSEGSSYPQITASKLIGNGLGIQLLEVFGAEISRNKIQASIGTGLDAWLLQTSVVDKNLIARNGADGIAVVESTGVTISRNRLSKNGGRGIAMSIADNATITGNQTSQSGMTGMIVMGGGDEPSTVENNRGSRNGRSGLIVRRGQGATVTGNRFNRNGSNGICVGSGNFDGGRNRAKGNPELNVSFTCGEG